MKTLTIDSNLNMPIASLGNQEKHDKLQKEAIKAQEEARTKVTDASDRVPQFDGKAAKKLGLDAGVQKGPKKHEHTIAESDAISKAQGSEERKPFYPSVH